MEIDKFRELNELREYLEIPMNEFKILFLLALKYQNENGEVIHEENLYQIVEEALNNMDCNITPSRLDGDMVLAKSVKEAFNRALVNLGYQKTKERR